MDTTCAEGFKLTSSDPVKSEVGRNSLKYGGPLIWNSHPNDLKELENAQTFKLSLQQGLEHY